MKLKALTLTGFKSFADKTKIEFTDGLTGIVGPNGSGKSNIIDALRWVLGEQSAKSLRGDKMADVIFGGSESRAALNRAEVSIEFDNSDQTLAGLPETVVICRRLYRSGESEFLINNKNVRLRDITDLFLDTGISRNSFSIISQGKVEAVFNSKPEERRSLIEEAAGISKYKKEKRQAQSELDQTTAHLARVADIITELNQQREPLEQQASLAKDYLAQKEQYDHYRLSELVLEIQRLKKEIEHENQELQQANRVVAKYDAGKQQQKRVTAKLSQESEQAEVQFNEVVQKMLELTRQQERMSGKKEMSQQERTFQAEKLADLQQQLADNENDLHESSAHFKQLKQQITAKQNQLDQVQQQLAKLANSQNSDPAQLAAEIEEIRQQILLQVQQRSALSSKIEYLKQSQQNSAQTDQKQDEQLQAQKAALEQSLQQQTAITTRLTAEQKKLTQLKEQVKSNADQLAASEQAYQEKKQQWYSASDIIHKAETQLETLNRVAANYGGYYQGAKNILQAKDQVKGIVGSVAELLELSPKYSQAVETVLGGQLQNIVTVNEQAAKAGIEYLNRQRLGRATFLPRTTVKPRHLAKHLVQKLTQVPGVLGLASDLVQMQADDQRVLNYLLGTTIIVSDLDVAVQAAKVGEHAARIVTLKGEVINTGGSMSGGTSKQKHLGLLEQKQQHEHLQADIAKMKEQLAAVELSGQQAAQQKKELQEAGQQLNAALFASKEKTEKAGQEAAEIAYVIKHQQAVVEEQTQADQQKILASQHLVQQIQEVEAELKQSDQLSQQLQKKLAEKQEATTAASVSQKKFETQTTALQQQAALETERLDVLQVQLKETENQQEQLTSLIDKQQTTITELTEKNRLHHTSDQDLQVRLAAVKQEIKTTDEAQTKLTQTKTTLKEKLRQENSQLQRLTELQEVARNEQQQKEVALSRMNTLLDRNLSDLSEQYGLTYEAAAQQKIETDPQHVAHQIKLLKMGLDDLGAVNLGAIDEFERINQRYNFLAQQQDDLLTAKDQLEKSMAEMDNEVKLRFKTMFDQVSASFAQVFPQIFEGGNAYLTLTDPSDLLETGIEITAQPPGKKAQQLSLLSGGERTLTAIALLFAILRVSPVPFAVLDEAEAALDDANVVRYSQYLRRLDQKTQFILITHRKGTMLQADVLYGVTMQDSGVSRMVSVSLEDVL